MLKSLSIKTDSGPYNIAFNPRDICSRVTTSNNHVAATTLLVSWTVFLSDSPLVSDYGHKPKHVINEFWQFLISQDLRTSINHYSDLGDRLIKSVCTTPGGLTSTFITEFMDTPVFKEYHQWEKFRDPMVFRWLLSFLYFGKKAEFRFEDHASSALCAWKDIEDRLGDVVVPDWLTLELQAIIAALLPESYDTDFIAGKNGSGAVAGDERGDIEKSLNFSVSPKLKRIFSVGSPLRVRNEGDPSWEWMTNSFPEDRQSGRNDTSRLMFVPKNYKTARSICMEPTSVMFFQQAIYWELVKMINSSMFGRFIQIHNQGRNQEGAMYGSRTNEVDTIDLSAASDRVHIDVVRKIFPRHILHPLLATRTSYVLLPDGVVRKVSKFAPMGSALCFPVQSLIFASVCILAYIRYFGGESYTDILSSGVNIRRWISRNIARDFRVSTTCETIAVYGDDIICDSRTTPDIVSMLTDLGFEVNTSKSFTSDDAVRESCGIYAISGIDITPFRFNVKFLRGGFDAKSLESMIAVCNNAGDYHYHELHRFLVHFLVMWRSPERRRNPVLFSNNRDKGTAIYSLNPHNSHLRMRINPHYQREEYRTWGIVPNKIVTPDSLSGSRGQLASWDSYSLHMFYRASLTRDESNVIVTPRKVLFGARVRWVWTPAY